MGGRLLRCQGLRGVMRGKVVRSTISDSKARCTLDRFSRQFNVDRPNQLWVSDLTDVSTWQGCLYVVFVIVLFARRIVVWRVSSSMRTDVVVDPLAQALHARQPGRGHSLVHHSDRGSRHGSIRYDEHLAETINGLCKAELIHRRAPWTTKEAVELATRKRQDFPCLKDPDFPVMQPPDAPTSLASTADLSLRLTLRRRKAPWPGNCAASDLAGSMPAA